MIRISGYPASSRSVFCQTVNKHPHNANALHFPGFRIKSGMTKKVASAKKVTASPPYEEPLAPKEFGA